MPNPVPVMIIGGIAAHRLQDAIPRTLRAGEIAGVRGICVHAISEDAKRFSLRPGFADSPVAPTALMFTVADAERAVAAR